jgi:formylglycine-generating enzyme required for sulfatase activity
MGLGWFAWGAAFAQQVDGAQPPMPPVDEAPVDASVFDAPLIEGVEVVDGVLPSEPVELAAGSVRWPGQDALPGRTSHILGSLLPVVPGPVRDGSPATDGPSAWDEPERVVVVDGVVWMMRAEVTRRQWAAVHPFFDVGDCPDCPVTEVSWEEAMQFARAVGQREARRYRLPTEAEWAAAAHAGQDARYPGGTDASEVAWTRDNSGGLAHPACTRATNPGGFCDLAGNAMEWTLDAYVHRPSGGLDAWVSPQASRPTRVVRGGSFRLGAREARIGWRMGYLPDVVFDDLGFRLVLDADAPPEADNGSQEAEPPPRTRRGRVPAR